MRAFSALASAIVAAVAVLLAPASSAGAATTVQFTRAYYDSPGTDNRSNLSLNAEYVALKNTTKTPISLYRWTVRDKANHVYTFTMAFTLRAGATVYLHTGSGTNTSVHRYWGSKAYIWNNDGDTAYLRNASGTQLDTCTWPGGKAYVNC